MSGNFDVLFDAAAKKFRPLFDGGRSADAFLSRFRRNARRPTARVNSQRRITAINVRVGRRRTFAPANKKLRGTVSAYGFALTFVPVLMQSRRRRRRREA